MSEIEHFRTPLTFQNKVQFSFRQKFSLSLSFRCSESCRLEGEVEKFFRFVSDGAKRVVRHNQHRVSCRETF